MTERDRCIEPVKQVPLHVSAEIELCPWHSEQLRKAALRMAAADAHEL